MRTKGMGNKIILFVFVTVICLSWLWWMLAGRFLESANSENREVAEKPDFSIENYSSFPEEYTAYFNDHLPFRSNLIALNNEIDYFVFQKSSNQDVIAGKNHWLFYSLAEDGDSIGCYQGTNTYSQEELELMAKNCLRQRDILDEQGREFIILLIPNKERVYSEFMPERYGRPAENSRITQVYSYLKENTDLKIVYPYDEIMEAKEKLDEDIWYRTDTHWNYIGAYVGASSLLKELGVEMPSIYDSQIIITRKGSVSGDLAGMLNLKKQLEAFDSEYIVTGYDSHQVEEIKWETNGAIVYHATNADPRKIYVIRDSFSSQMALYIGSQFDDSYLRRKSSYTYQDLQEQNPDIVVYETVERYLGGLMDFSLQ